MEKSNLLSQSTWELHNVRILPRLRSTAADILVAAVAYSHLYPNSVPAVRIVSNIILCRSYSKTATQVNKWPGQEEVAGDSKVRIRRISGQDVCI
jgi:hypothetical protein